MTTSPPPALSDEHVVTGTARLIYQGLFSPETVQRLVVDSYERLAEQRPCVGLPARTPHGGTCGRLLRGNAPDRGSRAGRAGGPHRGITMGCGDACPIVPGRRYLDWPVTDPEGAPIAVVRQIRDEIDAHTIEPLGSLPST